MRKTPASKITAILASFLVSFLAGNAIAGDVPPDALETARQKIMEEFARIDIELKRAAERLGTEGLTGYGARSALEDLFNAFPYAIDCTAVDSSGIMATVEPAPYRHVEGSDISGQEQVKRLWDRRGPVLSGVFMTVEGIEAVDAEYPVTKPDGTFLGSVSLLFSPERMLTGLLSAGGHVPAVFVTETNGRILYHPDPARIGTTYPPAKETGGAAGDSSASLYDTVWNIFLIK